MLIRNVRSGFSNAVLRSSPINMMAAVETKEPEEKKKSKKEIEEEKIQKFLSMAEE
jgi:hypothetical protein